MVKRGFEFLLLVNYVESKDVLCLYTIQKRSDKDT